MIHELKSDYGTLSAIVDGYKKAEVRHDDRGYALGDLLVLTAWQDKETPTRFRVIAKITHKLCAAASFETLRPGCVLLSIDVLDVQRP